MKKTNILRASLLSWRSGNFWCRNWNRHHQKPKGHRRFYQPTEKCKHKQEDGYWYEHYSLLHGSYWYEKWENWKLSCIWAWPPFVKILFAHMQEKWRIPASNSFQFSAQYTAILKWDILQNPAYKLHPEFRKSNLGKKTQKRSIIGSKKSSVFLQRKLANNEMKKYFEVLPIILAL